jgi:hypothetical protein
MTVKQILEEWLKARGYDGLCNAHCGCKLDNLIPCGECFDDCEPGYKQPNGDITTHKPEGVNNVKGS